MKAMLTMKKMKKVLMAVFLLTTVSHYATAQSDDPSKIVPQPEFTPIEIQHIRSPKEYYNLSALQTPTLVVIYEEWCGYSQITLKIMEQLRKDQNFLKTRTRIAVFDVFKEKKFKAVQTLNEVPRILLFRDGHEIHYDGLKNFQSIFNFLEKKLEMDTVTEVHDLKAFDEIRNKTKIFFLYFGERDTHRFKLFLSGHYEYTRLTFVQSNDPYVQDRYDLEENQIYYFPKKGDFHTLFTFPRVVLELHLFLYFSC